MKFNILFVIFSLFPLITIAETTTSEEVLGEPHLVNEIDPIFTEVPVREKEVLKGNPWGKIYLTSEPVFSSGSEQEHVQKIKFSLSVLCKGEKKKRSIVQNVNFCGYQIASFDRDLYKENNNINSWNYEPELNISQDGKAVTVKIKKNGNGSTCKVADTMVIPVTCGAPSN